MAQLIIFFILLGCGLVFGRYIEQKHYRSILWREKRLIGMPIITGRWQDEITPTQEGVFVHGSVVVASDYFKTVASSLKSVFGGNLQNYEALLDRGRREAILRMKEQANKQGVQKIINLRFETSTVGRAASGKGFLPCVEIHCYATGLIDRANV